MYTGSTDAAHNPRLRKLLLEQLAAAVESRLGRHPHEQASGCVLHSGAWRGDADQAFLLEAVTVLKVDVVVVLNQRLHRQLEELFKEPGSPELIMQPASGGVLTRTAEQRVAGLRANVAAYHHPSS